jgi:hypothetical protein
VDVGIDEAREDYTTGEIDDLRRADVKGQNVAHLTKRGYPPRLDGDGSMTCRGVIDGDDSAVDQLEASAGRPRAPI